MILDVAHKPWWITTLVVAAAAVGLYLAPAAAAPEELSGGSRLGLCYGFFGAALMLAAALLSVVRRLPLRWRSRGQPAWLRAHVWLGSLAAVFLVCHGGLRWGGPLEWLLWLVLAGVLATGVLGLVLQQVLPRLLARRVPCEVPPGSWAEVVRGLRRKADDITDRVCGPFDPKAQRATGRSAQEARGQLRAFYEHEVRPFLARHPPRASPLSAAGQAAARFSRFCQLPALAAVRADVEQLAGLCEERRLLAEQERLHFWLNAWLLLHVPLSAALLTLTAIHAISALYF
jgi:hypothetical protein